MSCLSLSTGPSAPPFIRFHYLFIQMKQTEFFADQFNALLGQLTSSDDTITKLEDEIDQLKADIDANLKRRNVSTDVLSRIYSHLCHEKHALIDCENNLKSIINAKEIDEIKQLQASCELKQVKIDRISQFDLYFERIFQLVQCLQDAKQNFKTQLYWKSNESINKANRLLETIDHEKENLSLSVDNQNLVNDLDFVSKKLKADVNIVYEKFIYDLIELFKQHFIFKDSDEDKSFYLGFLCTTSQQEYDHFAKCLLAQKNQFKLYVKNIFDQLTEYFLKTILLEGKCTIFSNSNHDELSCYNSTCDRIKLVSSDSEQSNLTKIENFIENVILLFTLNRSISNSDEMVKFIGQTWSDQVFTCIIEHFFEPRMPRIESEFDHFVKLLDQGHGIEAFMLSLGMIDENNSVLQNYTNNIKQHFSTKISQDFIIRTKKLLKSDLTDILSSEDALQDLKLLSKNKMPALKISRFMIDIKDLFEEMSALLSSSSSNLKLLLIETFVNVCELFVDISPFLFKMNIERNPRHIALFHNNCLFFGYLVECTVHTHRPRLDSLSEYAPSVRNLASQIFLNQMQYQEKLLLLSIKNDIFANSLHTIVDEIPSTDLKVSSKSHFEFRQCINNSLKHLNMLRMAFFDILPEKICEKAFNTLTSSFLCDFLSSIISLNDISSLGASHLSHELDYFSKELKLFLSNSENLVSKWMKLNEINFILKSSLLEIVNRWADGKGVLANYLTAEEVKHMIRALFQNNERRSNALSKIK